MTVWPHLRPLLAGGAGAIVVLCLLGVIHRTVGGLEAAVLMLAVAVVLP